MEKELLNTFDKELLFKDLSSRLPYGVKVNGLFLTYDKDKDKILYKECVKELNYSHLSRYWTLKPYLFPLSSMTDKDLIGFLQIKGLNLNSDELKTFRREPITIVSTLPSYSRHIDWLNKNHFDYRNLIDKNLAIDCTNLNIY